MTGTVVYVADEGYAMPLAAALRSLVDNASDPGALSVTVLTQRFPGATADRVRASCPEIDPEFVTVPDDVFGDLPEYKHISRTTYLRLLIPELLADRGPVLYVDSDTLALGDLAELCATSTAGCPLAAVQDPSSPRIDSAGGVKRWREMGVPGSTPYFNTGVMLIDPGPWQARGITEETLAYLRKYRDDIFLEQEALNAVLRGDWFPLDRAWNIYPEIAGIAATAAKLGLPHPLPNYANALRDPRIVHFAGKDKPWLPHATRAPYSRHFYHYLDRTAWSGWRPSAPEPVPGPLGSGGP